MPSIRRCPTCKVLFPTIDALNDHYKLTSHIPLDYDCESCKRAFKSLSGLQNHIKSNRRRHSKLNGRTPASGVIAQMDGSDSRRDDDDDWGAENDTNGWDNSETSDFYAQWYAGNLSGWDNLAKVSDNSPKDGRDPTLVEKRPSASSNNISKPPSAVSKPTLPAVPSWFATAKLSLSNPDSALARALSSRRLQDERLNVSKLHEATPPQPSVSKLDGSCSIATDLPLNRTNESKLPLNSPDNTTYPFICPGCRKDFKLFSGFVLHIENRSCKSSMCHEIEDRINKSAMQLFDTFTYGRI